MDVYELVRGPLAWIAGLLFVLGWVVRLYLLSRGRKSSRLYPQNSLKGGLRSILQGLVPFGLTVMRERPAFTLITFVFHLSVLILPVFLLAHTVLWYESWRVSWWSLPDTLADVMTVMLMLACIYFFVRRLVMPEVKQVSRPADYLFLIFVFIPCLTGFLAYHQWGPYRPLLILHVLSGEILLIAIPFSRLSHMVFFAFTRAYLGSEFGQALNAKDW